MSGDLDTLATQIREAHEAAAVASGTALEHAIRCGALLNEAKARVGHGGWVHWLATNFPASERTAQNYMRLAKSGAAADPQRVADLTVRGALAGIAKPRAAAESTDDDVEDDDENVVAARSALAALGAIDDPFVPRDVLRRDLDRLRALSELAIQIERSARAATYRLHKAFEEAFKRYDETQREAARPYDPEHHYEHGEYLDHPIHGVGYAVRHYRTEEGGVVPDDVGGGRVRAYLGPNGEHHILRSAESEKVAAE